MATRKQIAAARRNIKKAQAARRKQLKGKRKGIRWVKVSTTRVTYNPRTGKSRIKSRSKRK